MRITRPSKISLIGKKKPRAFDIVDIAKLDLARAATKFNRHAPYISAIKLKSGKELAKRTLRH